MEEAPEEAVAEAQPSRRYMGQFVSLHFVLKALSRRKRVWLTLVLVGLIGGLSLQVVLPRKYSAETTLLMFHNPADDPTRDMATDVALLQSEVVAQRVITDLGLDITSQKLTGLYQGVAVTDEVLQITFSAPTAAEAVTRANTLAQEFLTFRTNLMNSQNKAVTGALQREVNTYDSQIQAISTNIQNLGPETSANAAEISADTNEKASLEGQVLALNGTIETDNATTETVTGQSSVVAPATAIAHSALKTYLVNAASGIIAGLAIGIGLVAILAIASDRIRQRAEFAEALDAPVELSVGRFGRCRVMRKRRLRRRLSHPGRPVELMSRQLRSVVHEGTGPRRLAVVSVDSLEPSALSLAILAGRLAVFEGRRVMVTDMSPGRILGELLGVDEPETRIVFVKGAWVPVLVSVPPEDDPTVELPPHDLDSDTLPGPEWTSPQVTLVLSTLEPGTGASHLSPMVDEAVVVFTAGTTNSARVRATGQMLRAAGIRVRSAILVGADKNDDSLGLLPQGDHPRPDPDGFDDLMESNFASAGAAEHH
jgi:capsular polysaccharide biosynthesis protein